MKILAYHSIGSSAPEVGAGLYCVPEHIFRQQMEYARDKEILVTFDDGDITNYTKAYPILKELGMKAHFFIICEWVGAKGYMDWQQVRELKEGGMTIGSHGMTHALLTGLKDSELEYEFSMSKRILEEHLNVAIDTMSLPRGLYNRKVIEKVRAAGYGKVFTSDPANHDGFIFGRMPVRADWDLRHFVSMVENGPSLIDRTKELAKKISRNMIGDSNYDRLRTRILR